MGSGTQQTILQILTKPVINCERNDERSYARSNAGNRNAGDYTNDCLPAFGTEIPRGDKEFEAHETLSCRASGKVDYSDGSRNQP